MMLDPFSQEVPTTHVFLVNFEVRTLSVIKAGSGSSSLGPYITPNHQQIKNLLLFIITAYSILSKQKILGF